jgi:hypothetical protein
VPVHSLRTVCKSEWQTPQKSTSSSMSVDVGSRRGMVSGAMGAVLSVAPKARMVEGTSAL